MTSTKVQTEVVKRNGQRERVSFDKITQRLDRLVKKRNLKDLDTVLVVQKVISGVFDGVLTRELDQLAAEQCAFMASRNPDYGKLAAAVAVSNLHKETSETFSESCKWLWENSHCGKRCPLLSEETYKVIVENSKLLDLMVDYERDYLFDYFGFKTLARSYLTKTSDGKIVERPQGMYLRVAIGLHGNDMERVRETYDCMSRQLFIHATPTLFNAGTPVPCLASCYLLTIKEDSIRGIYETLGDCAMISKGAGGIGLAIHNVRASGSYIQGTNGQSNGLVPMIKVFNDTARYVDQCLSSKSKIVVQVPTGVPAGSVGISTCCIGSMTVGALVMTSLGRFRPVTKVLRYPSRRQMLYTVLLGDRGEDMLEYVTGEHQVLVIRDQGLKRSADEIRGAIRTGLAIPEYIDVRDLLSTDFIQRPSASVRLPRDDKYLWTKLDGPNVLESFEEGSYMYYRVSGLVCTDRHEMELFDLEVQDDESYVVDGLGTVHNGGGKRKGAFSMYLQPDHLDIMEFLELKLNNGKEEMRARDLFYAVWLPDLFMRRVRDDQEWSLFCPSEAPGLSEVYGMAYDNLYARYESEHRARKVVRARDIWQKILDSQMETGTPYVLFKDACNEKSNQKNLGTIKSSNLCVAPETMILVWNGKKFKSSDGKWQGFHDEVPISSLKDKPIYVWNGKKYSKTEIRQTGSAQKLIRIGLECNSMDLENRPVKTDVDLDVTPSHTFFLQDGTKVQAEDLKPGHVLKDTCLPLDEVRKHKVKSVQDLGRVDDVFCFTEPEEGAGVFNGVLAGNCTEIVEYASSEETAVCNLASISLKSFVKMNPDSGPEFDFQALHHVTKIVTRNLNRVIDISAYPTKETKTSNLRHRPIGIGVQGLADVFMLMKYPFVSAEAKKLNVHIFETMYHAALEQSCELSKESGPYPSYRANKKRTLNDSIDTALSGHVDSPASKGQLQFDMWDVDPNKVGTGLWNWAQLKEEILSHGLRNSLVLALMPTASTSQILGNVESFEPLTSNLYTRRVLAGEFVCVNRYLVDDLGKLGLWSDQLKDEIIRCEGSIQSILQIPSNIRELYKTVWEIPMKDLIDMAADRGAFIDQSQSMNLYLADSNTNKLHSMLMYGWQKKLKTGSYYIRSRPACSPIKFTISGAQKEEFCTMKEGCISCSS